MELRPKRSLDSGRKERGGLRPAAEQRKTKDGLRNVKASLGALGYRIAMKCDVVIVGGWEGKSGKLFGESVWW
jgi:hypothetical protein